MEFGRFQQLPVMGISKAWIYAAMPVGGVLMILYCVAGALAQGTERRAMIAVTCAVFAVLLVLGVPVAFTIGMAGFVGLWWNGSTRSPSSCSRSSYRWTPSCCSRSRCSSWRAR